MIGLTTCSKEAVNLNEGLLVLQAGYSNPQFLLFTGKNE